MFVVTLDTITEHGSMYCLQDIVYMPKTVLLTYATFAGMFLVSEEYEN